MPELPEVETIAASLRNGKQGQPSLLGMPVQAAQVLWARTLAGIEPDSFITRITGQIIQNVHRRGKFLIIPLSSDTLLVHLRMSGDLLIERQDHPLDKHHRLVLEIPQGWRIAFNDARKFGRAWLVAEPQSVLGALGPEPLEDDLTVDRFFSMLRGKRRQLKPLLLDQKFIAGLGNIYTDESLNLARLHPLLNSEQVSFDQAALLLDSIRSVLQEGIRRQGASIDWVYRGGDFQNYFRVYQRTGLGCLSCGTPVQRLSVGQRGTHICPSCQVLPGH